MSKAMWDSIFSQEAFAYGEEPNLFVKEMAPHLPLGCAGGFAEGEGRNAVYLAEQGFDVTVIDQSEVGLQKAQQLAAKRQQTIDVLQADLLKDELPKGKFDVVFNIFGHLHRDDLPHLLTQMIAALKSEGVLLFEFYSHRQLQYGTGGPGNPEYLYHPNDLLPLLEPYQIQHFFYGEVERYEGEKHRGRCHVIQALVEI